jgi:hypothetical protein
MSASNAVAKLPKGYGRDLRELQRGWEALAAFERLAKQYFDETTQRIQRRHCAF